MPFLIFVTIPVTIVILALCGVDWCVRLVKGVAKLAGVVILLGVLVFFYNLADSLSWGWSVLFFATLALIAIPLIRRRVHA